MSFLNRILGKQQLKEASLEVSPEFTALVEASHIHLAALTQAHQGGWHFGEHQQWNVDQQEGILRLTFADGVLAELPAQIVGSFNQGDGSWLWSWANPSIREGMKHDAEKVREYGQAHQMPALTTPEWKSDKEQAWNMAAITTKLCQAQGAFCGPSGSTLIFFTFGQVKLSKS